MLFTVEKLCLVLLLLTLANAVPGAQHEPEYDHKPADYSFSYGVKDPHTGDVKHQWEKKDGNIVRGQYAVLEPDGSVRTVDYTADSKNGFNAVVKHSGPSKHPAPHHAAVTSHKQVSLHHDDKYYFVPDEDELSKSEEPPRKQYYHLVDEEKPVQLPVDLSVVKPIKEKIVPVDITHLTPMEIELDNHQVHELSSEDLDKYLLEYYQTQRLNTHPDLKYGFKPLPSHNPQLYRSNKHPITTPGLRNFASKGIHKRKAPIQTRRGKLRSRRS